MTMFFSAVSHPLDLGDGRVLAPGETAKVDPDNPHNQALIERGSLLAVNGPKIETDPPEVETETDLSDLSDDLPEVETDPPDDPPKVEKPNKKRR